MVRRKVLPTQREYLGVLERYGSYFGAKVDKGLVFKVYRGGVSVSAGSKYNLVLDNSANDEDIIVSVLQIETDGRARIRMIKDFTYSGGTVVQVEPIVIGDDYTSIVSVYENVTYTGGVVIDGGQIQSQRGWWGIGGEQEFFVVFKIKAGQKMLIEIENTDSVSIQADVRIIFHNE